MKVIMLRDVGGVGQRGKVVDVSDGHALNYLIPNGMAVQATQDKVAELEKKNAMDAQVSAAKQKQMTEKVKALDGKKVVIKAKANEQGHLFKKVKKDDIAEAVINAGFSIDPSILKNVGDALQDVGEYSIKAVVDGVESVFTFTIEAAN